MTSRKRDSNFDQDFDDGVFDQDSKTSDFGSDSDWGDVDNKKMVKMRQSARYNMRNRTLPEALPKVLDTMGQVGVASKKADLFILNPHFEHIINKKKRGIVVDIWNFVLGVTSSSRLPTFCWDPKLWSEWILHRWEKFGLRRFQLLMDALSSDGNIDWNAVPAWRFIRNTRVDDNKGLVVAKNVGLLHIVSQFEIMFSDKEADMITDCEFRFICNKDLDIVLDSPHTSVGFTLRSWQHRFAEDWQTQIQVDMNSVHAKHLLLSKRQHLKKGKTTDPTRPPIHLCRMDGEWGTLSKVQSKKSPLKRTPKPLSEQEIAELLKQCQ